MNATDKLTWLWTRLTDALDFHAKKWYVSDDQGNWDEVGRSHIPTILSALGVQPWDHEQTIQQFIWRDQESHARTYGDVRRAQLRFNL